MTPRMWAVHLLCVLIIDASTMAAHSLSYITINEEDPSVGQNLVQELISTSLVSASAPLLPVAESVIADAPEPRPRTKRPISHEFASHGSVTHASARNNRPPKRHRIAAKAPVVLTAWTPLPAVPAALGEVAAACIGSTIYLVGEGSPSTFGYNIAQRRWSVLAPRLYQGNHHAAVAPPDGRMYLVGGLDGGSESMLQWYLPSVNRWSAKPIPGAFGGSMIAVSVDKTIFFCGGIAHGHTISRCGRFSVTTFTFSAMPSLPLAVNHAAFATDGEKIYVFGGRAGGSTAEPFKTVQIFDIEMNSWTSSDSSYTIEPLPQARGGMGAGIYLGGEFYIMGGESSGCSLPGRVCSRVDIYNPALNTWRRGPAMPRGLHGIYPVTDGSAIYVAGGGDHSGFAQTRMFSVLN